MAITRKTNEIHFELLVMVYKVIYTLEPSIFQHHNANKCVFLFTLRGIKIKETKAEIFLI